MPLTLSLVLLIENLLGLKTALESDVVLDKMIDLRRLRRVSSIFEPLMPPVRWPPKRHFNRSRRVCGGLCARMRRTGVRHCRQAEQSDYQERYETR
ncbi:hypothetical protein E0I00_07345 [Pseudomonas syringae pv. actinidiae]|nr:hypothetical protein [Pseudomonas syringae pv. actinidiae]